MLKTLYDDHRIWIGQTFGFDEPTQIDGYGYNLALHVADVPHQVLTRRAKLLDLLNQHTKVNEIVWLNQVHGACVADVSYCQSLQDADAMISNRSACALAIMTADCVPIALFDDEGQIACIHAGWQGLVAGVIAHTAKHMRAPKAYIGAAISQSNYEMDNKQAYEIVLECVKKDLVAGSVDEVFAKVCQAGNREHKVWFDVIMLAYLQLSKACATTINNISNIACSYADHRLYSHRRATHAHKKTTGRMAMLIVKKDQSALASNQQQTA